MTFKLILLICSAFFVAGMLFEHWLAKPTTTAELDSYYAKMKARLLARK